MTRSGAYPIWATGLIALAAASCSEELPAEFADYEARCTRITAEPVPVVAGSDPHDGEKHIYVCTDAIHPPVAVQDLSPRYPTGTIVLKASRKPHQDDPWLIAIADKRSGTWAWSEYTRNFPDEPYRKIFAAESVCTGCHADAAGNDMLFTPINTPQ